MTQGASLKMPSWEANISPANNPPKPKEKVNDVSLSIAQKPFGKLTLDILRPPPQKFSKSREKNKQKDGKKIAT